MGTREAKVETYLHQQLTLRGGTSYKWIGTRGVPDRICCLPGMGLFAVEVKTTDGKLSPAQLRMHDKMHKCGGEVYTVYGVGDVDTLIRSLK